MLNSRRNSSALLEPPKVKKDMDKFRRVQKRMKKRTRVLRRLFKKIKTKKKRVKELYFFFFNTEKVKLRCHNSFQIYKRLLQRSQGYIHSLSQGDQ